MAATDDLPAWTAGSSIGAPAGMHAIAVGAGRYVAVGDGGAIYTTAADGASGSWTSVTPITASEAYRAFLGGSDDPGIADYQRACGWQDPARNWARIRERLAALPDVVAVVGIGAQQGLESARRQAGEAALAQQPAGIGLVTLAQQHLERGVIGMQGLQDHLARPVRTPGPASDLLDHLAHPFERTSTYATLEACDVIAPTMGKAFVGALCHRWSHPVCTVP